MRERSLLCLVERELPLPLSAPDANSSFRAPPKRLKTKKYQNLDSTMQLTNLNRLFHSTRNICSLMLKTGRAEKGVCVCEL
jgi:hypothetical protein